MNILKNSWSFLSSSFSQSESDPNDSNVDTDTSKNLEIPEAAVDALQSDLAEDRNDDDVDEFADAVESNEAIISRERSDDVQSQTSKENSQEASLEPPHESIDAIGYSGLAKVTDKIGLVPGDIVQENIDKKSESVVTMDLDNEGENEAPKEGYSPLRSSDSDDSGEFIPPPAEPVGKPVDESQLNNIVNNLCGDLGTLAIEDEDPSEVTLPGEATLYVTAFDQTIALPPPADTSSGTVIEADLTPKATQNITSNDSNLDLTVKEADVGEASQPRAIIVTPEEEKEKQILEPQEKANEIPDILPAGAAESTPLLTLPQETVADLFVGNSVPQTELVVPIAEGAEDIIVEKITSEKPELVGNQLEIAAPDTSEIVLPDKRNLEEHQPVDVAVDKSESALPDNIKSAEKRPEIVENILPNDNSVFSAAKTNMEDPSDKIPVARGAYTIDFDNLNDFNPFQSSRAICNSPDSESKLFPATQTVEKSSFSAKTEQNIATESNHTDEPNPAIFEASDALSTPKKVDSAIKAEETAESSFQNINSSDSAMPETVAETKDEKFPASEPSPMPKPVLEDDSVQAAAEESLPVSKGAYTLDFDNLDGIDPFKTSKGISNSPTKPKSNYTVDFDNLADMDPFKSSNGLSNSPPKSPVKNNIGLLKNMNNNEAPEVLPAFEKQQNAPEKGEETHAMPVSELITVDAGDVENVDPAPKKIAKKPVLGANRKKTSKPKSLRKKPPPIKAPEPSADTEEDIIIPRGSYDINFDELEAMDSFQTSKGLANSPTKKTSEASFAPAAPLEENHTPDQNPESESRIKDEPAQKAPLIEKETPKVKKAVKKKVKKPPPVETNEEEELPIPKGSYTIDFDNLDAFDPFKSSSKGMPNSPTENKAFVSAGYDPFKPSKAVANSPPGSPKQSKPIAEQLAPEVEEKALSEVANLGKPLDSQAPLPEEKKNEIKTPDLIKPKKKGSGLARKKLLKPGLMKPTAAQSAESVAHDEPPLPKGSYNLDFENMVDPFKSSKGIANSPTKEAAPPVSGYSLDLGDLDAVDPFKPKKAMMNSPPTSPKRSEPMVDTHTLKEESEPTMVGKGCTSGDAAATTGEDVATTNSFDAAALTGIGSEAEAGHTLNVALPQQLGHKQQRQMHFDQINESEEFYPANDVFQDAASLDYLDKLGDSKSRTTSNLRNQSLYVKFDPLVSDTSPKQTEKHLYQDNAVAGGDAFSAAIIDSKARRDDSAGKTSQTTRAPANVSALAEQHHRPMDQSDQPYASQQSFGAAGSALKYTRADLDAILAKKEAEWQEEHTGNRAKVETLKAEVLQMTNVVKEYDRLFAEMSSNGSHNGMLSREQQLLQAEHEQSLEDLAALERQHEDLSRRYNRLKTVVAQFKQNESILKKSTNQVLEEAKEMEKKYVTMKANADEEIKKATEELQAVKSNAQQEVARAQAQLKMLELKCESLQSQIRDCTKENEELTKLCDDLIACSKQAE